MAAGGGTGAGADTEAGPEAGTEASAGTGEFSRLLAGHRVAAGLTQEELAAAAGVSLRALGDMERGRTRGPQRRTVRALARALGLDEARGQALDRAAQSGRPRGLRPGPARVPAQAAPRDPLPQTPAGSGPAGTGEAVAGQAGLAGERGQSALALPRDIADFTAREDALAALAGLAAGERPAHPRVVLISGQPGLGKTAFALHAAHTLAPRFPDGQLSLDLAGMSAQPLTARDALGQVLRALGVEDAAVPAGTEERAGLYRALVRDRRLVLVLDNAADEGQVRPLLPGSGPAVTIVTSRNVLPGLESVHRLSLDVLAPAEAAALLARIAGRERIEAAPDATAELARLCGYLPLALRIAGQRLVARPQQPVAHLVRQLAAEENRLDLLETGDLAVRPAFELSYRRLPVESRLVLRRCALTAGADFTAAVAAAYTGRSEARTELLLEQLVDAGLLQPATPDRYRLHDLVRLYAAERMAAEEPAEELAEVRSRAGRRILDRATAYGLRFDPEHEKDDAAVTGRAPAHLTEAAHWLEYEHPEWLAALHQAQQSGRYREVVDTAEAMHWFSDRLLSWGIWAEVFQLSVDAARALGDRRAEAVHVNYLAWTYVTCLHRYQRGIELAGEGLELAKEVGDREQQGWALTYLASGLRYLRRHREATEAFHRAADAFADVDSRSARIGRLVTLRGAANCLRESGRAEEAVDSRRRALAGALELVERWSSPLMHLLAAMTAHELGLDRAALRRWPAAEKAYRQALVHYEAVGRPDSMTKTLTELGTALIEQGRAEEARELLTEALTDLSADGPRPGPPRH
ncbi:NB-ARC domain-containing protein [Streptomyces sp. 1114.5]|uniref:ATP-binding protein n=1 Tax=Streptomyces sp. 1114.5 TaxID=1938830 RepID=UPI000EB450C4|nr:tetratricopeptide repeat protein [Streptomyces sp. 1114.5]RKT08915.1 NB-ARC domain-containing protein [Streptomyces sp. 1114.5]